MKLWNYLKSKMTPFNDKIAFGNSGITYKELLSLANSKAKVKALRLCYGPTREMHAINILKTIAEGNVAVPVSLEYGQRNYDYINRVISESKDNVDDLAFIMFTSGTTGFPKGVMLTEENIISNLECIFSYFDVSHVKTICIARPLVHIAVLTGELLYALCNGLTIYFYEETFIPQRLISYFNEKEIDVFGATPTLYVLLAKYLDKKYCSLKIGVISGEVLSLNALKIIKQAFPITEFYNVYGLTEHSPRVSALLPSQFTSKPGSVGKPIGDVKVKLSDGELLINSKSVMKGYFMEPEKTKTKIVDGWLYTGDMAYFDDEGFLYIMGRKDNMFIKAGLNIYPEEIELAVREILGVTDCVVYKEIKEFGIIICLKYVGFIDEFALRRKMIAILNPIIIPNKIIKVDSLEKTASGKKVRG